MAGRAAPVQVYSVPLLQAIAAVPEDTLAGNLHRLQAAEFLYETYGVCEQAIGQDADLLPNFHGLAADLRVAYTLGGRVNDAVPLLDQVQIREAPGMGGSSPMFQLCEAYLAIGRLSDACQLAERVLRLSSGRKERGNQAWALRLLGEIAMHREPPERDQAEAALASLAGPGWLDNRSGS